MNERFNVTFLEDAEMFLNKIEDNAREKIIYNIYKARVINDETLFKKLNADIWEFRTLFNRIQYRLLSFWDKENTNYTVVVATHGIIKKSRKMPANELKKATEIMKIYFLNKHKNYGNK